MMEGRDGCSGNKRIFLRILGLKSYGFDEGERGLRSSMIRWSRGGGYVLGVAMGWGISRDDGISLNTRESGGGREEGLTLRSIVGQGDGMTSLHLRLNPTSNRYSRSLWVWIPTVQVHA
jgi:hypothetical protein